MNKVASEAGVECKALDKNMERGAIFTTRQQWQEQIQALFFFRHIFCLEAHLTIMWNEALFLLHASSGRSRLRHLFFRHISVCG